MGHQTLTALSTYPEASSDRSEIPSKVADPLGLRVLYDPEHARKADIIFVHGLGGTSRLTWSKYKNLDLFWPLKFLPLEPDLCDARILTFGYNGNFFRANTRTSATVLDFAKDLLYDLKYTKNVDRHDLEIGNVSSAN